MNAEDLQRLTRLEVQFEHMDEKLKDTHDKVAEMHEILLKAKGAKWVIVGTATIASVVTATIVKVMPFLASWPK